eukprot:gene9156-16823_t
METLRTRSPDVPVHRRGSSGREHKCDGIGRCRDQDGSGLRLTAPVAVYPYERSRNQSTSSFEERWSATQRPAVISQPSSARKSYKSYSISEILKTNDSSTQHEESGDRHVTHLPSEDRYYLANRERVIREPSGCWSYEEASPTQACTACCQCYSALRYPCSIPYRPWAMTVAADRDAFHCGYSSTGMLKEFLSF